MRQPDTMHFIPQGEAGRSEQLTKEPQAGPNRPQVTDRQGHMIYENVAPQYGYQYLQNPPQEQFRIPKQGHQLTTVARQVHGTMPSHVQAVYSPQQEMQLPQGTAMESCPPPLSMNFHPQEFAPNHGYSSFFPPDQQMQDIERIKQLEQMLDVSMNHQQVLAAGTRTLKEQA